MAELREAPSGKEPLSFKSIVEASVKVLKKADEKINYGKVFGATSYAAAALVAGTLAAAEGLIGYTYFSNLGMYAKDSLMTAVAIPSILATGMFGGGAILAVREAYRIAAGKSPDPFAPVKK